MLIILTFFENSFLRDKIVDCQTGVIIDVISKSSVPSQSYTPVSFFATVKLTQNVEIIENVLYPKKMRLVKSDSVYIYSLDSGIFQIERKTY